MSDRWIANGQVNIIDGHGYGLTDNLTTFYIGTEADILATLQGDEGHEQTRRLLRRAGAYGALRLDEDSDGELENTGYSDAENNQAGTNLPRGRSSRMARKARAKRRGGT